MKKYLPSLLQISLKIIIVQTPTITHFKGLSIKNLQYEIKICQKQHTKVAMSTYANVVTVFLKQSLEARAEILNRATNEKTSQDNYIEFSKHFMNILLKN